MKQIDLSISYTYPPPVAAVRRRLAAHKKAYEGTDASSRVCAPFRLEEHVADALFSASALYESHGPISDSVKRVDVNVSDADILMAYQLAMQDKRNLVCLKYACI